MKITSLRKKDFSIVRRIVQLFDRTANKFKYNIDIWKEYLKFCIKVNSKKHFHKAAQKAISFHHHDLELWLLVVYFEL